LRRIKAAIAATVGAIALTSVIPTPAKAADIDCFPYTTDVGSGVNMRVVIAICRQGRYINSIQGAIHNNSKTVAHKGIISVEDNKNQSWRSEVMNVPPETSKWGPLIPIHANWVVGRRVCTNWMKVSVPRVPTHTDGYACWTVK
jgi:hypothetical protein